MCEVTTFSPPTSSSSPPHTTEHPSSPQPPPPLPPPPPSPPPPYRWREPNIAPYLCPATALNISDAFDAACGGNCGRGAARAFECVVAVVVVAPLLGAQTGVDCVRRLGECCRELGGEWISADRGVPRGVWSSTGVVGAVADERCERGVLEVDTVGEGTAEDAAVLFPLRKKFTLNPGTTMIGDSERSAVSRCYCYCCCLHVASLLLHCRGEV